MGLLVGGGSEEKESGKSPGLLTAVAMQRGVIRRVVSLCSVCVLFSRSRDELLSRI